MTGEADVGDGRSSAGPGGVRGSAGAGPDKSADKSADNDAGLDAVWAEVRARWDEQEIHDTFLGYCSQVDRLPLAAAYYRSARDEPERTERADAQLKKIGALALAQVAALPRTEPAERSVVLWIVMIVSVGFLLVWLAGQVW